MAGKLIQFQNCRLVRHQQLIRDDLWIQNGKIVNPEPIFYEQKLTSCLTYNCNNAIIAPGYIDIQINGGFGVDFSYDTETVAEGMQTVAQNIVKNGVTSFCPTLVTSPAETYRKILPQIPKKPIANGANILGVHLEGPFINKEKKGAHPEQCIRDFDKGIDSLLETYGSLEQVKIITLAPEKDVSGSITRYLTDQGITVAMGHSQGKMIDGEKSAQNGARLITHLFNAMLPFHHRDPGLVGLLASNALPAEQGIFYSIIADGIHTHPAAQRIAHRTHAAGLILVTDAISALGLNEGIHQLGQLQVEVREEGAFIAGTDTLCGSMCSLDACVRNFRETTGCSIVEAVNTVTLHPAECLGIQNSKGCLNFGADADFVLLDDDLNILSTWINGEKIFERCPCSCEIPQITN